MRTTAILVLPALLCATACGSPTSPTSTGVAGTVFRGPIAPVCAVNQPCEAPFKASFSVQRGTTRVTAFQSDEQGHFEVRLSPGSYVVVPEADAPIMSPQLQTKDLTVGTSGLTMVELHFDTGIR